MVCERSQSQIGDGGLREGPWPVSAYILGVPLVESSRLVGLASFRPELAIISFSVILQVARGYWKRLLDTWSWYASVCIVEPGNLQHHRGPSGICWSFGSLG